MSESSDNRSWTVTDADLIHRLVSTRGGTPAKVAGDGEPGAPRIDDGSADESLVEVDWEEFADRLDARDLAVEVTHEEGADDWSFEVVPAPDDSGEEAEALRDAADRSGPETSAGQHERAKDEVNADNHRDDEPFVN